MDVPADVLKTMRNAARNTVVVRHTYNLVDLPIKVAGKSGTAEFGTRDAKGRLPFHSWFVGFVPKDIRNGSFNRTDSQLVVLAFAYDSRTKGNVAHRDREVLPPAPLRDQEGLPAPEPPQARQLLPEQLMGVIRAEPARMTDWAAKSVGAAWRSFDLQLATYAGLLARDRPRHGVYNSVEAGSVPIEAGTTFSRGLMWAAIAAVVFVVATVFDYRWLKTLAWPIYGLQLGLLVLTLAIGDGIGGSARWVSVGPLTFQFSEIAKILMIIVLASYLASREGKLDSLASILGACVLVGPPLVLVMLQPDLGTSMVFGAILAGMLWMSGASLRWLTVLAAGVMAMVPFAWTYLLHDYQKARLTSFLDANPDIQGAGYQLYQAQIAVGSGGFFGKGLTNGTQTQGDLLPVQATDFVFATLAEELGFIGAIVLFVLFILLLWRVLVAGWRSRDAFGTLFAAGVASMVLFQLVVNVGMVLGVMPITGIPLPFVTHGGASLVSMAAGLGILQSINIRQTKAAGWGALARRRRTRVTTAR